MPRMRGIRPFLAGLGLCIGALLLANLWVSINNPGCSSFQRLSRGFCLEVSPGRKQLEEPGPSGGLLPHIDDCNFCMKCHIDESPPKEIKQERTIKILNWEKSGSKDRQDDAHENNEREMLEDSIVKHTDRSHLPNCTECRGCYHRLELMSLERRAFGKIFTLEGGNSAARILIASGDNVPGGRALVKVHCLPLVNERSGKLPDCPSKKHIMKSHQATNAVQGIAEDCGMGHMIPKSWVAPVRGVIEGLGMHVDVTGLWTQIVEGVPFNYVVGYLDSRKIHDLLTNHINSTEVVMAAALDVLISQCDRHDENIFVTETGQLSIIDHDSSFGRNWRPCGLDSIFIPTTQKYQINHLGYYYIMKMSESPRKTPSPTLLLDYRCHVEDQQLDVNFPPPFKKCLEKLGGMSVEEVMSEYGLTKDFMANNLLGRAEDMLRNGMEWTIDNGEPRNPPSITYGWEDPCCKLDIVEKEKDDAVVESERDYDEGFACRSKWNPSTLLPEGDPYYT